MYSILPRSHGLPPVESSTTITLIYRFTNDTQCMLDLFTTVRSYGTVCHNIIIIVPSACIRNNIIRIISSINYSCWLLTTPCRLYLNNKQVYE